MGNEEKLRKGMEIIKKTYRLSELTKDFAQVQAGFEIPNIEAKKEEFRTLLNEIRELQGKEPRSFKQTNSEQKTGVTND